MAKVKIKTKAFVSYVGPAARSVVSQPGSGVMFPAWPQDAPGKPAELDAEGNPPEEHEMHPDVGGSLSHPDCYEAGFRVRFEYGEVDALEFPAAPAAAPAESSDSNTATEDPAVVAAAGGKKKKGGSK